MSSRISRWAFERGGLLAIVTLVVYAWLAPTTIVDGDNSEFASLGAVGGRAHPTGYPAYVLYLRATSWIPAASPAHTAALATCLLGALAILVLHAACRAWGARPLAATIACAIYAASPLVLRMHVEAEVFAANALVVATVLWLAAANGPARGMRRGALLGLVAGLGLANHLTCAIVAPVGILGVIRGAREARPITVWAAAFAGLAIGLTPYLYLFVADGPISYGRVSGLGDLRAFVLREDYGGPGAFAASGEADPAANLGALLGSLGRAWLWLPGGLGLGALVLRVIRPVHESRWGWAMLATSFVVAGPVLALRFNVDPTSVMERYVVGRFHLLPILLLTIPTAIAIDALVGERARRPQLAIAVAAAGFVGLVVVASPRITAAHSPAVERLVTNTLASLPADAVVVVDSDDLCFGSHYVQEALGQRRDVDVVCYGFMYWDWYQDRLRSRGFELRPKTFGADVDVLSARRPVFFGAQARLPRAEGHAVYPYGVLLRVLPRGAPQPSIAEVVDQNQRVFAAFDLHYRRPGPDDDWPALEHRRYAATWVMLARELGAAGDQNSSRDALQVAHEMYPYMFDELPSNPP